MCVAKGKEKRYDRDEKYLRKDPMDLHEKVREEIELTESSTQNLLQQVIEEHFERLAGKGEISMGTVRTIAVQVSEELFQIKSGHRKKHMKQKDFLIQIIEEALEKAEAEWQTKTAWKKRNLQPENLEQKKLNRKKKTEPEGENEPRCEEKNRKRTGREAEPEEENRTERESEPEEETQPEEDLEKNKAEEPTEW